MGGLFVLAVSIVLAILAIRFLSKGLEINNVRKNIKKHGVMVTGKIVQVKMVRKKCGFPYVNKYYYAKAYPLVEYTAGDQQHIQACEDIVYDCNLPICSDAFVIEDNFKQHFDKEVQILYNKMNPEQIMSVNGLEAGTFNKQIRQGLALLFISFIFSGISLFLLKAALLIAMSIGVILYCAYYLWRIRLAKKEARLIKRYGERIEGTIIDVDVCNKAKDRGPNVIIGVPIIQYEVKGIQHYDRCCQLRKEHTLGWGRFQDEVTDKKYFQKSIGEKINLCCLTNDPSKYICSINQNGSIKTFAVKIVTMLAIYVGLAGIMYIVGIRNEARLQQEQKAASQASQQESSQAQQKKEGRYISLSYCRIASFEGETPEEYLFMGIVMDLSEEEIAAKKSYHITAKIYDGNDQSIADGVSSPDKSDLHSDGQAIAELLFPYDEIQEHKGPYSLHIKLKDNNKAVVEEKSIKLDQDFFNNKANSGAQTEKID